MVRAAGPPTKVSLPRAAPPACGGRNTPDKQACRPEVKARPYGPLDPCKARSGVYAQGRGPCARVDALGSGRAAPLRLARNCAVPASGPPAQFCRFFF